MGLAILCKELHDEEPQRFNFKAFVVDHQARAKSSGEARQVQKNLECLGKLPLCNIPPSMSTNQK